MQLKDPSTLSYQSPTLRRVIILAYWLIILCAIPLWWNTTSIERLPLDTKRVLEVYNRDFRIPITLYGAEEGLQREMKGVDVSFKSGEYEEKPNVYSIQTHPTAHEPLLKGRTLTVPSSYTHKETASLLHTLLFPETHDREVEYAPRFRLAFTLLHEDFSSMGKWDIRGLVHRHITPISNALTNLHNFTVESQIQFHAPLSFSPIHLSAEEGRGIKEENLNTFINSAEWTLSSSSSNDPVLHFVLFVPKEPLHILNSLGEKTNKKSFLLPQWGGVVLDNEGGDYEKAFEKFATQLLSLLALPRLPSSLSSNHSEWQLDALTRRRTLENSKTSKQTLKSTVDLIDRIGTIPVDKYVQRDVQSALDYLDLMHTNKTNQIQHSAHASTLANKAFFHPGMLGLLYFPAEHKYAVYTPLFASAMIPVVVAVMREGVAWRKERRA